MLKVKWIKALNIAWDKIRIVFGLILLFDCYSLSAFAIANLPTSECRPELIERPRMKKAGGSNKVVGKVSKFDPCHSSVSFKSPSKKSPPLIILLHGGGGTKDIAAIDKALGDMGMATLQIFLWEDSEHTTEQVLMKDTQFNLQICKVYNLIFHT